MVSCDHFESGVMRGECNCFLFYPSQECPKPLNEPNAIKPLETKDDSVLILLRMFWIRLVLVNHF